MIHTGALFRVLTLAAGVMMLDRLTKAAADAWLAAGRSVPVVPHIFHLTLVHNSGAAFGLLQDQRLFFIGVSVAAIVAIIVYLARHRTVAPVAGVALACILGGAAGNLADRLVFGYVVDFIDLRVWPVFNVADSAITIGAGLLIITMLADKRHTVHPAP